jgi:type III restriction enzyme
VRFTNTVRVAVGETIGADKDAIFEAQIRYTVEEHCQANRPCWPPLGIKVLSLFFIDRVDNYVPAGRPHPPRV